MNIDTSKYQMNIIVTDAESLVKNYALEEASIPPSLGFIIKPSSASTSSDDINQGNGNGEAANNNNAEE